ncbi:Monooxygenase, FAD-binding protein [Niveomyces insectorum RCEF 264]|uniref:Monooxygenase, FAD-binding protein n=1 Tax=Niveomyces insectorum RCEF 264 TaxID=1081102 RepID=A0A167UX98_9HYPO|nr:Monooxygenase, FAD-binding protein [Niveomyces insectorum RCEF 264]
MAPLRVLISGAGVAGNALAFWLSKLSYCRVTIVELAPQLRLTGLQIDLRGAGIDVLRRMGLEAGFRACAAPEQGLEFVDKTGRRRAFFPANKSGKGPQAFTSEFEIMRGDLCRLFYDATDKERARYLFGKAVDGFDETVSGEVVVRFTNGTTERFDLVVGADGVGSRVRKLLLGCRDGAPDPSFYPRGDSYVAYFTLRRPIEPGEEYVAKSYVATGNRVVLVRRHSPHEIQVYLICRGNNLGRLGKARRGDTAEEKAAMDEVFRGAGWQVDDILRGMADADDFYCQRMGLVKMDAWSRGRVALVGDAAYCPSANGFGSTTAVVGAYILAGEIARRCGPGAAGQDGSAEGAGGVEGERLVAALQAYERRLRPFMDKMQKSEEKDRDMMPTSAFGVAVLYNLVSVAAFLRLDAIAMRFYHPEKGLDLPDYGDVLRV